MLASAVSALAYGWRRIKLSERVLCCIWSGGVSRPLQTVICRHRFVQKQRRSCATSSHGSLAGGDLEHSGVKQQRSFAAGAFGHTVERVMTGCSGHTSGIRLFLTRLLLLFLHSPIDGGGLNSADGVRLRLVRQCTSPASDSNLPPSLRAETAAKLR